MSCEFSIKNAQRTSCQFNVGRGSLTALSDRRMACRFHMPLKDTSGNETAKAKWSEDENKKFNEDVYSRVENARGNKLDLSGVVFPAEITFPSGEYRLDFEQAIFHKAVVFIAVPFSEGSSFKKTNFLDVADFQHSKFTSTISFASAKFSGPSNFSNTVFEADADFTGSKFKNKSDFTEAQFRNQTSFAETIFENKATFKNTVFDKEASFNRTEFMDTVSFTEARSLESISFQRAQFHKATDFKFYNIGGQAHFEDAVFHKSCDFSKRSFGGKVFFAGTEFIGDAKFVDSQFTSQVDFAKAIFKKKADFFNTTFKRSLEFTGVRFEGHANFNADNNDDGSLSFPGLNFSGSTFKDSVLFINRTFLATTNFDDCTFFVAPKFQGCTLHQDTRFPPGRNFKDHTHTAAPAYRTLKLDMEKIRARQEEAMFNALEQKCQAAAPEMDRMVKCFSYFYELTSNYGQSLGRPIAGMLGVSILFILIHLLMAAGFSWKTLFSIIGFTIEQSVSPFKVWRLTDSPDWLCSCFDLVLLQIIATAHSLLFLAFFGLFILVLRWRFKRG